MPRLPLKWLPHSILAGNRTVFYSVAQITNCHPHPLPHDSINWAPLCKAMPRSLRILPSVRRMKFSPKEPQPIVVFHTTGCPRTPGTVSMPLVLCVLRNKTVQPIGTLSVETLQHYLLTPKH
jgi:hypothetical protein